MIPPPAHTLGRETDDQRDHHPVRQGLRRHPRQRRRPWLHEHRPQRPHRHPDCRAGRRDHRPPGTDRLRRPDRHLRLSPRPRRLVRAPTAPSRTAELSLRLRPLEPTKDHTIRRCSHDPDSGHRISYRFATRRTLNRLGFRGGLAYATSPVGEVAARLR